MEHKSDQGRQSPSMRRITRDQTNGSFGPTLTPVLVTGRGETIIFETQNRYSGHVNGDVKTGNRVDDEEQIPVTGPVYVEGAEVGDVLCLHIQDIRVASSGVAIIRPNIGILGPNIRQTVVRRISIQSERVVVDDGVSVPLRPVIGAIGVAPRHGGISTLYPGRHGGNMDTQDITVGTRVYLPVQVKGALLSLGAVKACMGDGETSGTGVEIAAEVMVRIDTLPGGRFSWPRLESQDACITTASASSVEQASRLAVMEMIRWLEQDKGLDFETAYLVVGVSGDLRISQWVNLLVTARVVLPKSVMHNIQRRSPLGSRTVLVHPVELDEPSPEPQKSTPEPEASAVPSISSTPAPVPDISSTSETPEQAVADSETQNREEAPDARPATSRRRRWRRRRKPVQSKKGQGDKRQRKQIDDARRDVTSPEGPSGEEKTPPKPPEEVSESGQKAPQDQQGSGHSEQTTDGENRTTFRRRSQKRRRSARSSSGASGMPKRDTDTLSSSPEPGTDDNKPE